MRPKNMAVTGGAGFIGSHLCERLINEGFRVFCFDNLATGSLDNIRHLLKNKDFRFTKHDVTKFIDISGKIDYVLHFASPASPEDYLRLPIQTLKVGSLGTHNALGLAKLKKARFLLASTSEIYGDPLVHPQREDYWGNVNPVGLRGCYDESKRFAEAITMAYKRMHKMDVKIVRIFNTFGPRMRMNDGRAVPNFIYQSLRNEPIAVYGRGKQTRSFCFIDDLIEGIYALLMSRVNDIFNLGNPKEISVIKLAKLIILLSGSESKIIYKVLPQDDPKRRRPDISKARKVLNWKPSVGLEDGLTRTIDYFRKKKI